MGLRDQSIIIPIILSRLQSMLMNWAVMSGQDFRQLGLVE